MQQTRRHILEILKERKEATIDEIVKALTERIGRITAVTVRHHLEILRGDGLVAAPAVRRRSAPGRPQYVYTLTDRAADQFPNNYQGLASGLLNQLRNQLPAPQFTQIIEGVASAMADNATIPDGPMEVRLDHIVHYLNEHGYSATWHPNNGGLVLSILNCPYEQVACTNSELCKMDKRLIDQLLGVRTQRISWKQEDDEACSYYLVPNSSQ